MCEAYLFHWQDANIYAANYDTIEHLWLMSFDASVFLIADIEVR